MGKLFSSVHYLNGKPEEAKSEKFGTWGKAIEALIPEGYTEFGQSNQVDKNDCWFIHDYADAEAKPAENINDIPSSEIKCFVKKI